MRKQTTIAMLMGGVMACGGTSPKPPAAPTPATAAPAPSPTPTPAPAPAPATAEIPKTPAGATLASWLEVFNGGDAAAMEAFVATYGFPQPAPAMQGFRSMTGGFELVAVDRSERLGLRFVVREKARPTTAVGWLRVKDGEPAKIESFRLLALPPGVTAEQMDPPVDAATRARVLDAIAARLTALYVYPETAAKMIEAMRAHQRAGAYDATPDARAFTDLLTEHLRAVSRDGHLRVDFSPKPVPEQQPEPTAEDKAAMRAELEAMKCGFEKAERLDGNIGYIKFDMFADAELCGASATAAFAAIGDVDALIFDLRENGGGEPAMVAFVSSYLFAKRTHLNDIHDRAADKTTAYFTDPGVPGRKFPDAPVYVLTSKQTFSGAEEFTYNLKNLRRATIVGETTGGGAHPTMPARLDEHFVLFVPFARAINPITKTNWEGTGVEPDVKVAARDALDTARRLAAERLSQDRKKRKKPPTRVRPGA